MISSFSTQKKQEMHKNQKFESEIQPVSVGKPEKFNMFPEKVHKLLQGHDFLAINELYSHYKKKFPGLILNMEPEMNVKLQICAFLALIPKPEPVLLICSNTSVVSWCFHCTKHANYDVIRITEANCNEIFQNCKNSRVVYILETNLLNLGKNFHLFQFQVAIVEDIDQIANKKTIKNINAKFRIGISYRNFYESWDPNLVFNMLRWACSDIKIQLKTFLEVDKQNCALLLDNYRFWWYRLTWNFCDSFEKPTEEELERYRTELDLFGENDDALSGKKGKRGRQPGKKAEKSKKKRKSPSPIEDSNVGSGDHVNSDDSGSLNAVKSAENKKTRISTSPIEVMDFKSKISLDVKKAEEMQAESEPYEDNSIILSFLKNEPSTSEINEFKKAVESPKYSDTSLDALLQEAKSLLDD